MLGHHAKFKALSLENILTASDGTRKGNDLCSKSSGLCYELSVLLRMQARWVKRYLSTAGIAERAVFAQHLLANEGMGEPLQNINIVLKAANITVHDQGLHFSPRKVTVSASGLVPQLKHFLHESNCALAVLETLREELRLKNIYKVLFEYVMLEGVNDRLDR
ncbi:hypothetical protein POTOM_030486 [Populus tomentosa]|uniref:Uncharacterized protein n=1 Tax=Populus tomentosa TaxID=118781 RepID=A0A8X7ZC61_POPTO|nr:hypothetical protein POTOM_030486 [Populus tomentosa]